MALNSIQLWTSIEKKLGSRQIWAPQMGNLQRNTFLNGALIDNGAKVAKYAFAGDLMYVNPDGTAQVLFTYKAKKAVSAAGKVLTLDGSGYTHIPEVGDLIMKAPTTLKTVTADTTSGVITEKDVTGQSYEVEKVEYNASGDIEVTVKTSITSIGAGDIFVEATGATASATAKPLVTKVNGMFEIDQPMYVPMDKWGIKRQAFFVNAIYGKAAMIRYMSPMPAYIKALNKSLDETLFLI